MDMLWIKQITSRTLFYRGFPPRLSLICHGRGDGSRGWSLGSATAFWSCNFKAIEYLGEWSRMEMEHFIKVRTFLSNRELPNNSSILYSDGMSWCKIAVTDNKTFAFIAINGRRRSCACACAFKRTVCLRRRDINATLPTLKHTRGCLSSGSSFCKLQPSVADTADAHHGEALLMSARTRLYIHAHAGGSL